MTDTTTRMLDLVRRRKARTRKMFSVLLSLSLIVALGVTWSLRKTGESLAGDAYCGITEHTHTDECVDLTASEFSCGLTEHTHTEDCYTTGQICGLEEAEAHTHTEDCYTLTLTCGQEEAGAHTHTAECYTAVSTLTCTETEHTHSDSCYTVTETLLCTAAEHTHTDACYDAAGALICTESEHTHSDSCYDTATTLTCTTPEHTHTDACCSLVDTLTCGLEETEGHAHTDACYTLTLTCGLEETGGHTHTDECYGAVLSCTETEHTHSVECVSNPVYSCGMEEHTHTLACYSDPDADVETEQDWNALFAGLTLSGDASTDLLTVARSQLGYTESTANFEVLEDGVSTRGYTRYGAYTGAPYGEWNARFVTFCLHYANVSTTTATTAGSWVVELAKAGHTLSTDTPAAGSLVFFDTDDDGEADTMGIVSALTLDGVKLSTVAATEAATDATEATAATDATDATEATDATDAAEETTAAAEETTEAAEETTAATEETTAAAEETTAATEAATPNGMMVILGDDTPDEGGADCVAQRSFILTDETIVGYYAFPVTETTDTVDTIDLDDDTDTDTDTDDDTDDDTDTDTDTDTTTDDTNTDAADGAEVDTAEYAARVEALLAADDKTFVSLWLEYNDVDEEEWELFENYLCELDEETLNTIVNRVNELINGAVEPAVVTNTNFELKKMITVNFYAFVDGAQKLIETRLVATYLSGTSGDNRRYLSANDMEAVYGVFGLKASDIKSGTQYIAHTGVKGSTVWTDAPVKEDNYDLGFVPALESDANVDVYYLPKGTVTSYSAWSALTSTETFYTVTVEDPLHIVYGGSGQEEIPDVKYVLTGNAAEVTVKSPGAGEDSTISNVAKTLQWQCSGTDSSKEDSVTPSDDYCKFTITSIAEPYVISLPLEETTKSITYYALIDENQTPISTVSSETVYEYTYTNSSGNSTTDYYLTAERLAEAYAAFGVTESDIRAGKYCFPSSADTTTLWGLYKIKNETLKVGDAYLYPIVDNAASVFFLPNSTEYSSGKSLYKSYATSDTYCTVKVTSTGGTTTVSTDYWLTGKTATVTVKKTSGASWTLSGTKVSDSNNKVELEASVNSDGTVTYSAKLGETVLTPETDAETGTTTYTYADATGSASARTVAAKDNGDGTITFTITGIDRPFTVTPTLNGTDGTKEIIYYINLPETKTPIDTEYDTPTIGGGKTYVDYAAGDTYTFLTPSPDSYFYVATSKYWGEMTFQGWAVSDDSTSVKYTASEKIDTSNLANTTTELYAVWSYKQSSYSDKTASMVNFFVSLETLPEGTTDWTGSTSTTNFTDAVYTADCKVEGHAQNIVSDASVWDWSYGEDPVGEDSNGDATVDGYSRYILGGTSGASLDKNDSMLREYLGSGKLQCTYKYTDDNGKEQTKVTTCTLTFPTDEEVLESIRENLAKKPISANGHTFTAEEITTTNFTVKWYVFKYAWDDSWHVDGILVAKTGTVRVTKTFAGDSTAIQAVKDAGYNISVSAVDGQNYVVNNNMILSINATANSTSTDDSGVTTTTYGYDKYDEATQTYTWIIPVDQQYVYSLKENSYSYEGSAGFTTIVQYKISNSTAGEDTDGWTTYRGSNIMVHVTGLTYDESNPDSMLTLSYQNTYIPPGTILIEKADAATGNLIPNVTFTIGKTADASGASVTDFGGVYDLGDGYYATTGDDTHTEATTTIKTNDTGIAWLAIDTGSGAGTYTFTESVLTGYYDPGTISAKLEFGTENTPNTLYIVNTDADKPTAVDPDSTGYTFAEVVSDSDGRQRILRILNYSTTADVELIKNWDENENKTVKLQLYRNGVPLGSDYAVTLDGSTDTVEYEKWKGLLKDLPLYVDNAPAVYTIVEEEIDSFLYSNEYDDGYRYFDVNYTDAVYQYYDTTTETWVDTTDLSVAQKIVLQANNRQNTGEFSFSKRQSNGTTPISGAEFKLYGASTTANAAAAPTVQEVTDENTQKKTYSLTPSTDTSATPYVGSLVGTAASSSAGTVNFGYLAAGYYYLVESDVPYKYVQELTHKVYLVDFDGTTATFYWYDTTTNDEGTANGWTALGTSYLTNTLKTAEADLTLTKVDSTNGTTTLSGASFTLKATSGSKKGNYAVASARTDESTGATTWTTTTWNDSTTTITTDSSGVIKFSGLPEGTYTLTETAAPDNYRMLSYTVTITVDSDGSVSFSRSNGTPFVDEDVSTGTALSDGRRGTSATLKLRDDPTYTLPNTGGMGTQTVLLSGLLLMGLSLMGIAINKRRRERRSDE